MLGIKQASDITLDYCCNLMVEYSALDCAQIFSLLKRYGGYNRKQRMRLCQALCRSGHARELKVNNRHYFVRRFQVKIEGEIKKRIQCFWVLLDYMNQVDQHYASGTPSSLISMEIDGRDYSILYAETGKEKLCNYQMERGGVTRYFVVVENLSQIPLIKGEQIHAFVLLDEKNTVHYYSPD